MGDLTTRRAAIDERVVVDTNHPGAPVLTDALAALATLEAELPTSTPGTVQTTVAGLTAAGTQALTAQALVGAPLREIAETGARLDLRSVEILDRRQEPRDADPAESLLKLAAAQAPSNVPTPRSAGSCRPAWSTT